MGGLLGGAKTVVFGGAQAAIPASLARARAAFYAETRARGAAIRDAGLRGARNTRSAALGLAVGLARHGWDDEVFDRSVPVVAAVFSAAATRLCAGDGQPAAQLLRAHTLRAMLGSGILSSLAAAARMHFRHPAAPAAINAIAGALRAVVAVAQWQLPGDATRGSNGSSVPTPGAAAAAEGPPSGAAAATAVSLAVTVSLESREPALIAATATAESFLLGEAVTEAVAELDTAAGGLDSFDRLTSAACAASPAGGAVGGGGALALLRLDCRGGTGGLLRAALADLTEAAHLWPRLRDERSDAFVRALAEFRQSDERELGLLGALVTSAARLAAVQLPAHLLLAGLPPPPPAAATATASAAGTPGGVVGVRQAPAGPLLAVAVPLSDWPAEPASATAASCDFGVSSLSGSAPSA